MIGIHLFQLSFNLECANLPSNRLLNPTKNILKQFFQMLPFALGLTLLVLFYISFSNTKDLLRLGIQVKSEVVGHKVNRDSESRSYRAIYAFRSQDNVEHYFYGDSNNSKAFYPEVGEIADLIYMPSDFKRSRLVSFWGLYFWPTIYLAIALPLLFWGLGDFWFRTVHIKNNRPSHA